MIPEQVLVSTTTDSDAAARQLAADAVEARLGACAQVVGPITSVYRWEGRVHTDPEWRVEVKTAADRADALVAHLRQRHTYDVPEVITTPIVGGSADYLAWVVEQTRPK
ncbi:divalent-cation tolerance protein CutA [Saccharomonospora piscinae]|uniref:Divalent-cation tolerance protein CutA n=1 Tax=Saccharomonospora piscinae TaxID=687388 RepID=A0A1V9A1G0_SACPI|nr:divalent-cation tolerance protein CutA [Saccharomonospora piscinae]OQO90784.1 divalent-cation tolerance protein CutA [Saccharomonospora piscinae]